MISMRSFIFLIGFLTVISSCAEREIRTVYKSGRGVYDTYTATIFGDTLTLSYRAGCIVSLPCVQYFSPLNDSTLLVYSTGISRELERKWKNDSINKTESELRSPEIDKKRETLSQWDFCYMDNDTVYRYTDSLLISISGTYKTFLFTDATKQKRER